MERFVEWAFWKFYAWRGGRVIFRTDHTTHAEVPYLARVKVFRFRWFGLLLHCLLSSDEDGVHDHPWDNASLILAGRYVEEFADGTSVIRGPGTFVLRRAEQFHRLVLTGSPAPKADRVYTAFFIGKRRRRWGFLPDSNGWRAHSSEDNS